MAVELLPDVEALVSAWLRADVDVTGLIGQRVYTDLPARDKTWPLVRLTRAGGAPTMSRPLYADRAVIQMDVWGGAKATARDIAETIRQRLCSDDFRGTHPEGVVTAVEVGQFRWLPDTTFDPPKPRYIFDLTVSVHR